MLERIMTKLFHVKIKAYGYMADFNVEAEDSAESIEQAVLDKIGKKDILFKISEKMFSTSRCWITYEEVVDDTSSRPLQEEKVVRT